MRIVPGKSMCDPHRYINQQGFSNMAGCTSAMQLLAWLVRVNWRGFKYGRFIIVTSKWARWRLTSPISPFIQITNLTVYSGADQTNHQNSASLAFVRGIHQWRVNSPRRGPVTQKMFPFDDVIMVSEKVSLPTDMNNNAVFVGSNYK